MQELSTDASNFVASADAKSNQGVTFDSLAQHLLMNPNSGPQRVVAKFPAQTYGQFEVSARVSVHPAVVTSIDVRVAEGVCKWLQLLASACVALQHAQQDAPCRAPCNPCKLRAHCSRGQ